MSGWAKLGCGQKRSNQSVPEAFNHNEDSSCNPRPLQALDWSLWLQDPVSARPPHYAGVVLLASFINEETEAGRDLTGLKTPGQGRSRSCIGTKSP